jgi:hypothetical protein
MDAIIEPTSLASPLSSEVRMKGFVVEEESLLNSSPLSRTLNAHEFLKVLRGLGQGKFQIKAESFEH